MLLLEAMARMEGFGKPGNRPTRNNNPGDLEYGLFTIAHGATGGDPRFAVFPDVATGYKAMQALLASNYEGMTIETALLKYAPPIENDDNTYLNNILSWTGLQGIDIISDHLELPESI